MKSELQNETAQTRRTVNHALTVSKLHFVRSIGSSTALCTRPVWPSGQSIGLLIGPVIVEHLLRAIDWAIDRYPPFISCTLLCIAGRLALCLQLRPVFYLTPLTPDLCAIFSYELKNSTNKILCSPPKHISFSFYGVSLFTSCRLRQRPGDCYTIRTCLSLSV